MNKYSILRLVLFGLVGYMLAEMGFPLTTWQFWVMLLMTGGVQITTALENRD